MVTQDNEVEVKAWLARRKGKAIFLVKNAEVRRIDQENMEKSENPPKDIVREDSGKMLSKFFHFLLMEPGVLQIITIGDRMDRTASASCIELGDFERRLHHILGSSNRRDTSSQTMTPERMS